MNSTNRVLAILAGLTALVVPSQAVISFSNYTSDFTIDGGASNQIDATPSSLSNFVMGSGIVTDSGSFDIQSSAGINDLFVDEVDGIAMGGTLSLVVNLHSGASASSSVMQTLYTGSVSNGVLTPTLMESLQSPLLTGTHAISYVATFTGASKASLGYLGGFAVDAYEPVPEPAPLACMGIGVIGLIARRRRSQK